MAGFAVLSRDQELRALVASACESASAQHWAVGGSHELAAITELHRPDVVIVDLAQVARISLADRSRTILCVDAPAGKVIVGPFPPGSRTVIVREVLPEAIRALAGEQRSIALQHAKLASVDVLTGVLDQALERAANQIAEAFVAERCVISVRGDSIGTEAGSATHTWDSVAWSETTHYCRLGAATETTLIVKSPIPEAMESILAIPIENASGGRGFLAVIATGPRLFTLEERASLRRVAARITSDLAWRVAHERTVDELDRVISGPGFDPLLGVWNRAALDHLAAMYASAALRFRQPLTAVALDVVGMHAINTQHGHEIGDRVLRRVADALRATLRTEDVIGRWSGDTVMTLLQGTALDSVQAVATRIKATLDARPIEVAGGATIPIRVRLGVCLLEEREESTRFCERAVAASNDAAEGAFAIARPTSSRSGRNSQQIDVGGEFRGMLGGTYRLLHEISRGGMGVVYRAEDLALERPVAIKMLRPDLGEDHAFVEQLRKEAALLAKLQHPNLVQVYSFGQVGGDSYFVMELVEGEGLADAIDRMILEETAMPLADALTLLEEVASALDTLHDRGIIHRDVKSENVIRDPFRNRSVLVDVGIARRFGQFSESAGTPGFVAPEVIRGGEASARSDVYGLAVMAYELLTLDRPWGGGEPAEILLRQLHAQNVPSMASLRPEVADADPIMRAALSADPAQRPTSAGAFVRALKASIASSPPLSRSEARGTIVPASATTGPTTPATGVVIMPLRRAQAAIARTRGVVFRSVPRAFGAREATRLRDAISTSQPELAQALAGAAPLAWLPTELLTDLLSVAPAYVGRDVSALAQEVARATVRATFRRFFPASSATLVPERTLSAVRNIWSRYQSWGMVSAMPVNTTETVIKVVETLGEPELCSWTRGMLEQLVVLSGGTHTYVDHEACEARGDPACLYRVTWQHAG